MVLYGTQDAPPLALLSYALDQELGMKTLPEIRRTERGKPYFPDQPRICFSWSHSGRYVLCALSRQPVGVDLEVIRPRRESLPRYAFTDAELSEYYSMGGGWPAFYALWTRKEAWCKYTGDGLMVRWGQTPPWEGLYYGAYAGGDWQAAVCGEEYPPAGIHWVDREELP